MSWVDVGLSSAQRGAVEVENVRMFLCELARSRLFIKVFCFVHFFFYPLSNLLLYFLPLL